MQQKTLPTMVQFLALACSSECRLNIWPSAGLELARLADLPPDVLVEAKRVSEKLTELQNKDEESSDGHHIAIRRKALLRVNFSDIFNPNSSCMIYTKLTVLTSSERSSSRLMNILPCPIRTFWSTSGDFKLILRRRFYRVDVMHPRPVLSKNIS